MASPPRERRPTSALATALRRLLQARTRERWLRRALWFWCVVLLVWLLPIGTWTAPGLAPVPTILIGTLLVTVGVAFQRHVGLVTRHVAGFALLVSLWTLLVSLWTGVFFGPRVRTVRSRVIPLK